MTALTEVRMIPLPTGEAIPVLGQGTWHIGEDPPRRLDEIAALRLGIDLGMSLIDTAEMYADGRAEELVGEAIEGHRDEVFLVSKVRPHDATRRGTIEACELSLMRLGVDTIDFYLLHWRGPIPPAGTLEAFAALAGAGKIRNWGVSNFDVTDLEELIELPGGDEMSTDQVLYNLQNHGIEFDLLPWCDRHSVPIMAYSPIEQGRPLTKPALRSVAARHRPTPAPGQAGLSTCGRTAQRSTLTCRPPTWLNWTLPFPRLTASCRLPYTRADTCRIRLF
jgi:diketogulonate reductase-like aldo/keto reductase